MIQFHMIARAYGFLLQEMLGVFPVVALIGPRQIGKSTLVTGEDIASGRRYATMDSIPERSLAQSNPVGFLDDSTPLTIDEVQLAPGLVREIKRRVDARREPGQYLITGSADLNAAADLSHILAGRVGVLELPPLTRWKVHRHTTGNESPPDWVSFIGEGPATIRSAAARIPGDSFDWKTLAVGGFPVNVTASSHRARTLWTESFRTTYLERDLRQISDIGNLMAFSRLMELTAARTGTILNQASLARDVGIPTATVGRYLSILEASLLIRRVPGWYANIGKRIVKSPKLFWRDTGIATHLAGIDATRLAHHPLRGALFETLVHQELAALLPVFVPDARLFHLRTHDGLEIDAVIQSGEHLVPVEIKSRQTVTSEDARSIERWFDLMNEQLPRTPGNLRPAEWGMIIYSGTTIHQVSRRVWALPLV
jgi:predicted AAA+ superfamily ATPase